MMLNAKYSCIFMAGSNDFYYCACARTCYLLDLVLAKKILNCNLPTDQFDLGIQTAAWGFFSQYLGGENFLHNHSKHISSIEHFDIQGV